MDTVIGVENLRETYGHVVAVDDVSFDLRRGEIFGILGSNGAGKTTTVEILQGLRTRTGGRVEVLGLDPAAALVEQGVMPEDYRTRYPDAGGRVLGLDRAPAERRRRVMTAYLTWTELKLLAREPLVLVLSLMFPILLMVLLESIGGVLTAFAVGILAFAGIGALLGSVMPSSRAAQGLGLLLFLGTFLLVGGGPPPGVLPDLVKDIAAWTPTGLLIDAIRSPWAGGGPDWPAMTTLAVVAIAGFALAMRRLTRS